MSKLKKQGTENEAILKIKRNLLSIHIEEIKSNNSISKEEDEMIHMKTKWKWEKSNKRKQLRFKFKLFSNS